MTSTQKPQPLAARDVTDFARRTSSLIAFDAQPETPAGDKPLPTHWSGTLAVEGELTGDGRLIENEALTWETPSPLRFVLEDTGAHVGAVTIGRILSLTRAEDGKIDASGDFDLGSEVGREAARLVGTEVMNGISVDLDSVAFEVRVARELYDEREAQWAELMEDSGESDGDVGEKQLETDDEGRVILHKMSPDEEIMAITSARLRGATLVSIPAFVGAKVFGSEAPAQAEALVASAAPVEPPLAWFEKPEADGPTALTVTDEGQVFGHLATWDTCHVADPSGAGVCVMAPKNTTDYAYFHVGAVKTSEGTQVPTGTIRFDTTHASLRKAADAAAAHYENTGLAGADIHVTDGKHGIWVAGALRPNVSPEQLRALRAAPLSGDWRYIEGKLELVGALAVNLPGFPVPRVKGMVASGAMSSLVSAGMLARPEALTVKQFSDQDASYLQKMIDRERLHEQRSLVRRGQQALAVAKAKSVASKLSARKRLSKAGV